METFRCWRVFVDSMSTAVCMCFYVVFIIVSFCAKCRHVAMALTSCHSRLSSIATIFWSDLFADLVAFCSSTFFSVSTDVFLSLLFRLQRISFFKMKTEEINEKPILWLKYWCFWQNLTKSSSLKCKTVAFLLFCRESVQTFTTTCHH